MNFLIFWVCPGSYKYHGCLLDDLLSNRSLFRTVLEPKKSKVNVLADSVSAEDLFPGSSMLDFSLCPHMGEGTMTLSLSLSGASFIWALVPFIIWATVSSWSCFCWLYRASPSLAAKNIINLILVLTIWWCPCVESSLVLLEDGVCYDQCIFLAKLY